VDKSLAVLHESAENDDGPMERAIGAMHTPELAAGSTVAARGGCARGRADSGHSCPSIRLSWLIRAVSRRYPEGARHCVGAAR